MPSGTEGALCGLEKRLRLSLISPVLQKNEGGAAGAGGRTPGTARGRGPEAGGAGGPREGAGGAGGARAAAEAGAPAGGKAWEGGGLEPGAQRSLGSLAERGGRSPVPGRSRKAASGAGKALPARGTGEARA